MNDQVLVRVGSKAISALTELHVGVRFIDPWQSVWWTPPRNRRRQVA
jgi:hypothetical protein